MADLLKALGQRVRQLRDAKKWSQEEFAHIAGLHRTYAGQVERGEKNLSFTNLVKISVALGVTMEELLVGLEAGSELQVGDSKAARHRRSGEGSGAAERRMLEIRKTVTRLEHQRTELDRTLGVLQELVRPGGGEATKVPESDRSKHGATRRKKSTR